MDDGVCPETMTLHILVSLALSSLKSVLMSVNEATCDLDDAVVIPPEDSLVEMVTILFCRSLTAVRKAAIYESCD